MLTREHQTLFSCDLLRLNPRQENETIESKPVCLHSYYHSHIFFLNGGYNFLIKHQNTCNLEKYS